MEIYNKIIDGDPFCYVRITDVNSMISSELMSEKLNSIISDDFISDDLFIGIPCELCYKEHHDIVVNKLSNKNVNIYDANILINDNYVQMKKSIFK